MQMVHFLYYVDHGITPQDEIFLKTLLKRTNIMSFLEKIQCKTKNINAPHFKEMQG